MNEKSEALKLANAFETHAVLPPGFPKVAAIPCVVSRTELSQAASELRRQHAEIERLKDERDEAVKAEREACAKVCDDHRRLDADLQQGIWVLGTAITLAAAIRARGEVPR